MRTSCQEKTFFNKNPVFKFKNAQENKDTRNESHTQHEHKDALESVLLTPKHHRVQIDAMAKVRVFIKQTCKSMNYG